MRHTEVKKSDLAAARVPGFDLRAVTPTQENIWAAGVQGHTHHLKLVVQFYHLLSCKQQTMEKELNRNKYSSFCNNTTFRMNHLWTR